MASDSSSSSIYLNFRSLISRADRKFARVRDLPAYTRGPHVSVYHRKVFKAYTHLWHFQQSHRRELVNSGLSRCEIGELASRIGQLYYDQYVRTGEWRFLLGAYVFYEAILERGYFEGKGLDLRLRCKELRFVARFLIVAMLVNRDEAVRVLSERLKSLVEESREAYPGTNFKEWKQVIQELGRFLKAFKIFPFSRTLRYISLLDSYPNSFPHLAPLYAKRCLKLHDAVLTSYHKNEVKFTELTLDTSRMQQCLEYEPSASHPNSETKENNNINNENGILSDHSGGAVSGLIDINLASELADPNMPKNPRKAVIYRPKVSHLISVIATLCEEMSADRVLLVYISASADKLHAFSERSICLGPRGNGDENILYPEDIIPFTRIPLFLIIDSENSQAFKVINGKERSEPVAMLLSPSNFNSKSSNNGSLFTYFLTAPLEAFCILVDLSSEINTNTYNEAEVLVSSALAEIEETICKSIDLDRVWMQLLADPLIRRLILRFIFCRSVLFFYQPSEEKDISRLPDCVPCFPDSLSPDLVKTQILILAEKLGVVNHFPSLR
ncbi:hypothetical protein LUZ60_002651 [Juncus effusus]|nr:hypothetical protein LUZ60_002651 [Juncus effusus]